MTSEQPLTKKKLVNKSKPFSLPSEAEKVTLMEQPIIQPTYPYVPVYPTQMIPQPIIPQAYLNAAPIQQPIVQHPPVAQTSQVKQPLKKASQPFQKAEQTKQAAADDYFSDIGGQGVKQGINSPVYTTVHQFPGHNAMYMVPTMNQDMMQTLMTQDDDDGEEYDPELLAELPDEMLDEFQHEYFESQIDEIMRDLEQFEEKMKDCTCCKGYVYACKGKMCQNLGKCQCMVHEEMENQAVEDYIPECQDCTCCRGYVYTCLGQECQKLRACKCFVGMDED